MKKISIVLVLMSVILFSCKKDKLIEENFETIKQHIEVDGEILEISYLYNSTTEEYKEIESKDNQFLKKIREQYDESILLVKADNSMKFYKTREEYAKDRNPNGANSIKSSCKGYTNVSVKFYADKNYNTLNDTRTGDQWDVYNHYRTVFGTGWLSSDLATPSGNSWTLGFRQPWVGSWRNDKLSSLKIQTADKGTAREDFTVVLFRHSNYGGKAIAFDMSACVGYKKVSDLKNYNYWAFGKWDNQVSSYFGYFRQASWI